MPEPDSVDYGNARASRTASRRFARAPAEPADRTAAMQYVRNDLQPFVASVIARDALRERRRRPFAARGRYRVSDCKTIDRVRSFVRAPCRLLQDGGLPPG